MQETRTVMLSTGHQAEPEPVEIPLRVGSVKLSDMLGEGAGGVVFAGFDDALNRKVAVKFLHRRRNAANHAATVELLTGVRSAGRINHPNIITLHNVTTVNEMPVIVMEYVDGVSLRELMRRTGAMRVPLALYTMRAVVAAAAYLHDAGVIHRDLKPANVLFDRDGDAHVCDFGLACEFDRGAFRGQSAAVVGTPLYMAPEVFDGHFSPQGDVYALGVMLFEALAGAPPFAATSVSEIQEYHKFEDPPLHMLERRGIAEDIREIVRRALHKRSFLRHKTAGHLQRAFDEIVVADAREDTLRTEIANAVVAPQDGADAPEPDTTAGPPAATTFDLLAQRAREKRSQKRED